jgi:1-acyl-sn-glycerol-3-phosphate acyltransferase
MVDDPHASPGGLGPRPSDADITRAMRWLQPLTRLVDPVFVGVDRIPERTPRRTAGSVPGPNPGPSPGPIPGDTPGAARPLLFVGNHTLFGMIDSPFLYQELWRTKGIYLRALGDHAHFEVPLWREFIQRCGVVDGTRDNCAALMAAGEAVLVFPGGAREAAKRKGEKYQLIWGERRGFVKMAVEYGCTIVPFAALGAEDALDIVTDAEELLQTRLGPVLQALGLRKDLIPPRVRGIGPTFIPRPERLYFEFCEPLDTAGVRGQHGDDALVDQLREAVRGRIEAGLERLRERRAADPRRPWLPRLMDAWRAWSVDREP